MIDLARRSLPISLYSERLAINRASLADAEDLYKAARASIDEVYPFLPWCHPDYAISETRNWLQHVDHEWARGSGYAFVIRDKRSDEFLGGCGLNRIDEHPVANLGYWVKTSASKKGVASEAAAELARFGLEQLGLHRIEIIMSVQNRASRKVAEKAGAVYEGRLRNRLLLHGANHDAYVYSIIPRR